MPKISSNNKAGRDPIYKQARWGNKDPDPEPVPVRSGRIKVSAQKCLCYRISTIPLFPFPESEDHL